MAPGFDESEYAPHSTVTIDWDDPASNNETGSWPEGTEDLTMYYVKIDIGQLETRLRFATGHGAVDLAAWLAAHGFHAAGDGWCGTADSMNCLSCSEILYSEHLSVARTTDTAVVSGIDEYATAAWFV